MKNIEKCFILEKDFLEMYGVNNTTYKSFEYNEFVSRQTGRTYQMVKSFPLTGNFYVLIHSKKMIKIIEDMYAERKGNGDIEYFTISSISDIDYFKKKIKGQESKSVFIDNAVFYILNKELLVYLNETYERPTKDKELDELSE